jgi:hypothetical protein
MDEQFVNPEVTKLDGEIESTESAQTKIEHIAEKAAEKSTKTVQKNEKNQKIFTI